MRFILTLFIIFVSLTNIFAQKEEKIAVDIYSIPEKADFYSYGKGKILKSINVKKVKKDQSTVENVLIMQISADNAANANKLYKSGESYTTQEVIDKELKYPRDSVYFLLENKLELTKDGKTYCVVKGKYKTQGHALQPTVQSFEKINGKWYFGNEGEALDYYHTLFFTMSVKTITEILVNKKSPNKYLNDIILQSLENGIVNLDTFYKVLNPKLDKREPEIKEIMEPSLIKK